MAATPPSIPPQRFVSVDHRVAQQRVRALTGREIHLITEEVERRQAEAAGRQGEEAAGLQPPAAGLPSVGGLLLEEAPLSVEDHLSAGEPLSAADGHSHTERNSRRALLGAALLRRRRA